MELIKPLGLAAALLVGCGLDKPLPPAELTMVSPDLSLSARLWCGDLPADPSTVPSTESSEHGLFTVSLLDSEPSPPILGNNIWTLAVKDATGAMVESATLTAFGWPLALGPPSPLLGVSTISATSTPGEYAADLIYQFMGAWQVTFAIQPQTGTGDSVNFTFCVRDS